jgi:hypothetical protein
LPWADCSARGAVQRVSAKSCPGCGGEERCPKGQRPCADGSCNTAEVCPPPEGASKPCRRACKKRNVAKYEQYCL